MNAEAVIDGLVARGIPRHIAAGIAGNFAVESGFDPGINEIAPLVEGSRGGYGLAQWTGPRRVQYEQFAQERGTSPDDLNAQLDFLMWELGNTEKRAGDALSRAGTAEEAARIFSEKFLRPGIPHLDRRVEAARGFAGYEGGQQPTNALTGPASQPQGAPEQQNALAQQQPQMRIPNNMLDPRAFQTDTRRGNRLSFT